MFYVYIINNAVVGFIHLTVSFDEADIVDIITDKTLSRNDIENYFNEIEIKITDYITKLNDEELLDYPENCEYTKFTLILQMRDSGSRFLWVF